MGKQIEMLEYHSHLLTQMIDIQLYRLALFIRIFFLCDIVSLKQDGTACGFLQKIQAP